MRGNAALCSSPRLGKMFISQKKMVIPPPVRPSRVTNFLKPCLENALHQQVRECPSNPRTNCHSCLSCKLIREDPGSTMGSTRDVEAAAKFGKRLGERLLLKDIPAVTVFLKRDQKYHGKVKAVIDALREVGIKLLRICWKLLLGFSYRPLIFWDF